MTSTLHVLVTKHEVTMISKCRYEGLKAHTYLHTDPSTKNSLFVSLCYKMTDFQEKVPQTKSAIALYPTSDIICIFQNSRLSTLIDL